MSRALYRLLISLSLARAPWLLVGLQTDLRFAQEVLSFTPLNFSQSDVKAASAASAPSDTASAKSIADKADTKDDAKQQLQQSQQSQQKPSADVLQALNCVTFDEGVALARELGGLGYSECSSKHNVGLQQLFDHVLRTVARAGFRAAPGGKKKCIVQ